MDDIYLKRMEILLWFWWCMYHDLLRSKEVKFWSKPSNQGQIGQISRNIPTIHMFGLQILSWIQIWDSPRSNQVIKGSNLGQNRQIRVKSGRLIEIYLIYIWFDSEFCPKFKLKILWGQISSSRGQTWVKLESKPSN